MRILERPSTLLGVTQQHFRGISIERFYLISDNIYYQPHSPHKYFSVRGERKFVV